MTDLPEFIDLTDYVSGEYRYLYCLSRLDGNSVRFGREDANRKMVIRQESHAVQAMNEKNNDYLLSYTMKPINEEFFNEILFEISADDFFWTHVSIYRTENIKAEDADLLTVENTFIWLFDIPLIQFGLITYVREWNQTAYLRIKSRTMGEYTVGSHLFVRLTSTVVADFIVTKVDGINEDDNEIFLIVSATDPADLAALNSGEWVFSANEPLNYIDIRYGALTDISDNYYKLTLDPGSETFPSLLVGNTEIYKNYLILWEDGKTSLLWKNIDDDEAIVKHIDGEPEKLDTTDPGKNLRFVILNRSTGIYGNLKFRFGDTITDEILNGRKESEESLYYLQNRFFDKLPNGNLSAIKSGAYFSSSREQNEYQYSQLEPIWRAGTYRPDLQKHILNYGNVTRLKDYPDGVVIFGEHFTLFIDVSLTSNVGDENFGEFILQFQTPQLITDEIGTAYSADAAELNKGEIVLTNQPSIRFFNGYNYADDITYRTINKEILTKLKPFCVSHWNPNRGYFLWGIKDE